MSNICPICKSRAIVEGSIVVACELCLACIILDFTKAKHPRTFKSMLALEDVEIRVYYEKMWPDLKIAMRILKALDEESNFMET